MKASRSSVLTLVLLALDGLRRKLGRNLLTMSGVFIGVLALTLIVSLGQGIAQLIETRVRGEDNLRQVGLSPGFGHRIEDDADISIEGEMDAARRARLKRAALARTRPGTFIARRAQTMTDADYEAVARIPHVVSVHPIVAERYRVRAGEHETTGSPTLGVDTERRRYAERVIAGGYFTSKEASEVLIHEYLAYRWGYVTQAELESLCGQMLTLTTIQNDVTSAWTSGPAQIVQDLLDGLESLELTEAEREVLPGLSAKVLRALGAGRGDAPAGGPVSRDMKIVGVVRELEPTDPFSVIEDGNAIQIDLFLPQATAVGLFLESPANRELGFRRAVVMVDDATNAKQVEEALRNRGHSAYSVGSVVERVEGTLAVITVIIGLLTGIALVVAALGIVNTMVTSVLERTSEIGLWKAVGATNGQVRAVFLIEAAALGLVGGLLGLGAALLLMIPGEAIAADLIAERAVLPIASDVFRVPFWLPFAGPLLAMLVAMLASLYPSQRAARVDPVTALRHD